MEFLYKDKTSGRLEVKLKRIKLKDLLENKPIQVNPKTELTYDIIKELDSLREDVAIRINNMEEQAKELLQKLEDDSPNMFIDPNPFDDENFDQFGNRIKRNNKINAMYDKEYFSDKKKKNSKDRLLNARLEKR